MEITNLKSNISNSFLLDPPAEPLPASLAFLRQARFCLQKSFLVKIEGALALLNDDQIWWRPNDASNSIGNLILHLTGNARQWIIAGVGGAEDTRDRRSEFAERDPLSKDRLLEILKATIDEVDAVLAKIESEVLLSRSDERLLRQCLPQGFSQTVLDAVFHVVEHFSYHTGQIIYIAKSLEGGRIRFYDDRRLAGKGY